MTWIIPSVGSDVDFDLLNDYVFFFRRTEVDGVVTFNFYSKSMEEFFEAVRTGGDIYVADVSIDDGELRVLFSNNVLQPYPLPSGGSSGGSTPDLSQYLTATQVGDKIISYVLAEIDEWSGTIAQSDIFTSRTERMTLDTDGKLNAIGYDLGLTIAIETANAAYPFRVQVERWDGSNWHEMFRLENADTQKPRIQHTVDIPRPYNEDNDSFRLTITSSTTADTIIAGARMEVFAKKPYHGVKGDAGPAGPQGPPGDPGPAGVDGPPGRPAFQGVWDNTKSYKVGDSVLYRATADEQWGLYVRTDTDTGPVNADFNPAAVTEWQSMQGGDDTRRVDALERKTGDLHTGSTTNPNYVEVDSDGSLGGIANTTNFTGWTLEALKAHTNWSAPTLNNVEGWHAFRIPADASASHYSVILGGGDIESIPLSGMRLVGHDDDWKYYEDVHRQPANDTVKLLVSGHTVGFTQFDGIVGNLRSRGPWQKDTTYYPGNMVTYLECLCLCVNKVTSADNPKNDAANWDILFRLDVSVTDDGEIQVALDESKANTFAINPGWLYPRGDWTAGVFYTKNNLAKRNGVRYLCLANHTAANNNRPTNGANWKTYWEVW